MSYDSRRRRVQIIGLVVIAALVLTMAVGVVASLAAERSGG
jgi:hypothetical protein